MLFLISLALRIKPEDDLHGLKAFTTVKYDLLHVLSSVLHFGVDVAMRLPAHWTYFVISFLQFCL